MLVILDLNGTLVDASPVQRPNVAPHARARYKFVYVRPYTRELLSWMFEHPDIEVAVWTSRKRVNADALLQVILSKDQYDALAFLKCRDECIVFANFASQKPLLQLVNEGYAAGDMLIVDDSPEKIAAPPDMLEQCYLHVPSFVASPESLQHDTALRDVQRAIEERISRT